MSVKHPLRLFHRRNRSFERRGCVLYISRAQWPSITRRLNEYSLASAYTRDIQLARATAGARAPGQHALPPTKSPPTGPVTSNVSPFWLPRVWRREKKNATADVALDIHLDGSFFNGATAGYGAAVNRACSEGVGDVAGSCTLEPLTTSNAFATHQSPTHARVTVVSSYGEAQRGVTIPLKQRPDYLAVSSARFSVIE